MATPNSSSEHGGQLITIGLRDLYDQLQIVSSGYTSLSAKLDTALIAQTMNQQSFAQQLADIRHDQTDHEARIRAQESRVYITPKAMWTAIGVITGVMGTLFSILWAILASSS